MSQVSRAINSANLQLRELDAIYPGGDGVHPLFQWRWSNDLVSLVPQYEVVEGEARPVLDYRCRCGVNRNVHAPDCSGITVAKVRFEKTSTFGQEGQFKSYHNCWVLCRWLPPPGKDVWIDVMGTDEDYPSEGRYVPVHRGLVCVVIPPAAEPNQYSEATRVVIRMMLEHQEKWRAELQKNAEKSRLSTEVPVEDENGNVIFQPGQHSKYWRIRDRVIEKLRKFNPTGTVGYTKSLDSTN
jgi:hypothetical protein